MTIGNEVFVYNGLPTRVVFGSGTSTRVGEEARRIGVKHPLVLSTPEQKSEAQSLAAKLGMDVAGVFSGATMHTPVEVTEKALQVVTESKADGTIALGGGSTTGLGKAIALRTDLPQIVLPTTYAGSEMTNILGETSEGRKKTWRSRPSARWPKACPQSSIGRATPPRARRRSTARGCAARCSARSAWLCITNFATSSAVRLICPTRRRTRLCCLTW